MNINLTSVQDLDILFDGVFITDITYRIIYVNNAASALINTPVSRLIKMHLDDILSVESYKQIFTELRKNKVFHKNTAVTLNGGTHAQLNATQIANEQWLFSIRHAASSIQYEKVLKNLSDINYNPSFSLQEKIHHILEIGLKFYNLDLAVVSKIDEKDNKYQILYVYPKTDNIKPGMIFNLKDTYCHLTFKQNTAQYFRNIEECPAENSKTHPCYAKFALEAYIGVVLLVNGKRYGTLSFASQKPRAAQFSPDEVEFIHLIKTWIENELSREQYLKKLEGINEQLEQANKHLSFLANYDQLTGLANRTLLFDNFSQILANVKRYGGSGAVLFIDINNFKAINDQSGHTAGDAVLKYTAQKLVQVFRESDLISRYGGDEFIVVLQNITNRRECESTIGKLLMLFQDKFIFNNDTIDIKISIGVSFFNKDQHNITDLINKADKAMYKAKESNEFYQFS